MTFLQVVGRAGKRKRNALLCELLCEWEVRTLLRLQTRNARGELPVQQGAAWREDRALAKTCAKDDAGMVGAYMTGCVTDLGAVTVKAAVAFQDDRVSVGAIGTTMEANTGSEKCNSSHCKICSIPKIYTYCYK